MSIGICWWSGRAAPLFHLFIGSYCQCHCVGHFYWCQGLWRPPAKTTNCRFYLIGERRLLVITITTSTTGNKLILENLDLTSDIVIGLPLLFNICFDSRAYMATWKTSSVLLSPNNWIFVSMINGYGGDWLWDELHTTKNKQTLCTGWDWWDDVYLSGICQSGHMLSLLDSNWMSLTHDRINICILAANQASKYVTKPDILMIFECFAMDRTSMISEESYVQSAATPPHKRRCTRWLIGSTFDGKIVSGTFHRRQNGTWNRSRGNRVSFEKFQNYGYIVSIWWRFSNWIMKFLNSDDFLCLNQMKNNTIHAMRYHHKYIVFHIRCDILI